MEFKLGASFAFLLVNTFISQLLAISCYTSKGEFGTCLEIRQCPRMLAILRTQPLLDENRKYLQNSRCRHVQEEIRGSIVLICCPSQQTEQISVSRPTNSAAENLRYLNPFLRNLSLLPSDCGEQTSDRILGGERADLDEFPWMVLLEYLLSNGGVTTGCGGVLINKRYVLTAAHCIKGLPYGRQLVAVRLGEFDTQQELDCIGQSGYRACADPTVTIPIEEQIPHENFVPTFKSLWNDIALLRLAQDVTFTDFIKPICLPSDSNVGQFLDVAGWGITENDTYSNVKIKLKIPLVENQECFRTYRNMGLELGAGQICVGGQEGKDSCRGDSGGPLMSRMISSIDGRPKWVSVGVVSFGPLPCGKQGVPGVYTKVYDFLPWILRNMRQ